MTGTPSRIVAPCMRAPLASAIVTSTGFGAAVLLHVEAGEDVVGAARAGRAPSPARARDLVHVDAAVAVERRDAAILFEAIGARSRPR